MSGGFPDAWTLFYWAWWIAYAPLMGLFFGRISRGRTIRQTVLGIILWGSLGCISFLSICGAYALHLELDGVLEVSRLLSENGIPATVVEMISVAEESNTLDKVLVEISDNLERTTIRRLDLAVRLLEPIMLLIMAAIVLCVVIALLMPIMKMSTMMR